MRSYIDFINYILFQFEQFFHFFVNHLQLLPVRDCARCWTPAQRRDHLPRPQARERVLLVLCAPTSEVVARTSRFLDVDPLPTIIACAAIDRFAWRNTLVTPDLIALILYCILFPQTPASDNGQFP